MKRKKKSANTKVDSSKQEQNEVKPEKDQKQAAEPQTKCQQPNKKNQIFDSLKSEYIKVISEVNQTTNIEHYSYSCTFPGCNSDESYKSVKAVREHIEGSHLDGKVYRPFRCLQCGTDFTLTNNLRSHQKQNCKHTARAKKSEEKLQEKSKEKVSADVDKRANKKCQRAEEDRSQDDFTEINEILSKVTPIILGEQKKVEVDPKLSDQDTKAHSPVQISSSKIAGDGSLSNLSNLFKAQTVRAEDPKKAKSEQFQLLAQKYQFSPQLKAKQPLQKSTLSRPEDKSNKSSNQASSQLKAQTASNDQQGSVKSNVVLEKSLSTKPHVAQNQQQTQSKEKQIDQKPDVVKALLTDHCGLAPPSNSVDITQNKISLETQATSMANLSSELAERSCSLVGPADLDQRHTLNWSEEFLTEPKR